MWIYFLVMLLVSYLTISWGTMIVVPTSVATVRQEMIDSMALYNPNATDDSAASVTDSWDQLQSQVRSNKKVSAGRPSGRNVGSCAR